LADIVVLPANYAREPQAELVNIAHFEEWMRQTGGTHISDDYVRQGPLVEQDNIEERAADVQSAVVIDEPKLSELIQKETDP
jgi:hypothetical protein